MNPTTWKLEQLITRARIQAAQSRFWLKQAALLWALCSVLAFALACQTPARKAEVVPWVLASVTPFRRVKWQGQWYEPRSVARYLSVTVYDGTFGQWLGWSLGLGLLPVVLIGGGGFWYVRRPQAKDTHVRGAEVVPVEELRRRVRMVGTPGVTLAAVQIPAVLERSHVLICGATGSGKTV